MNVKDKEDIKVDELKEYKGKWQNVYFSGLGPSPHYGHSAHDTEESAKRQAEKCVAESVELLLKDNKLKDKFVCRECGLIYWFSINGHAIQLPIGDK